MQASPWTQCFPGPGRLKWPFCPKAVWSEVEASASSEDWQVQAAWRSLPSSPQSLRSVTLSASGRPRPSTLVWAEERGTHPSFQASRLRLARIATGVPCLDPKAPWSPFAMPDWRQAPSLLPSGKTFFCQEIFYVERKIVSSSLQARASSQPTREVTCFASPHSSRCK